MNIRMENAGDITAVRMVEERAFGRTAEAELVDALRVNGAAVVSMVAEEEGNVVGHILFSPVSIDGRDIPAAGLGPMAVMPERQRAGVGSALVRAGLERCRELGYGAVVVLGHPEYYPRFGFAPARQWGLRCEYSVPDEVFMALELRSGALAGAAGLVRYRQEFASVGE